MAHGTGNRARRDQRTTRCTTEAKDRHRGTPQGSPISPLLAEPLLPSFPSGLGTDSATEKQLDAYVVNYADDLVICCRPGNGSTALATMRQLMTRLGLTVERDQDSAGATTRGKLPDFLGYSIGRFYGKDGAPYIGTRPSRKAVRRFLLQRVHDATTPHKHAEDPELRVVRHQSASLPRLGRVSSTKGPVLPTYKVSTLVCSNGGLQRWLVRRSGQAGDRIPPVSGQASLRDAWPLCLAAQSRRPGRARRLDDAGESRMREICMSGCVSSEGWHVQQEANLPG